MLDLPVHDATSVNTFPLSEPQGSVLSAPPNYNYWPVRFAQDELHSYGTLLFEQQLLRLKLVELSKLQNGWDGYGAASISDDVVNRAQSLLATILTEMPAPDLVPNPNGTISLQWESESGFLHLEIGERDYSFLLGSTGELPRGAQADGLPSQVLLSQLLSMSVIIESTGTTSITAERLAV